MDLHPAAELFPPLTGAEYDAFKADIASNGLLEAIWTCEGKILDGRNRQRACEELAIKPRYRKYKGDSPVAFAWSQNGARRHLGASKLAVIAVNMLPALEVEAKNRQAHGKTAPGKTLPPKLEGASSGESTAVAAGIVGVSKTYIADAKRIKKADPELFKKVEAGEVTVNKALKIITGKDTPPDPNSKKQPRAKRAADIKRLAAEGHLTAQIAELLGIGIKQVKNIAKAEGIALPDARIRSQSINVRRVIETTVSGLEGYALGLQTINGAAPNIGAEEAKEWAESIKESLKPINRLYRQLTEVSNGKA